MGEGLVRAKVLIIVQVKNCSRDTCYDNFFYVQNRINILI